MVVEAMQALAPPVKGKQEGYTRTARRSPAQCTSILLVSVFATACFYGHPATGVVGIPEDQTATAPIDVATLALFATDDSGNEDDPTDPASDDPEEDTTTETGPVYLFRATSTVPNGDLRNGQPTAREGADLTCNTSPPSFPTNCTEIRAFISIDGTDQIVDMPDNYNIPTDQPIYPTGGASLQLATDWDDLLNTGTPLQRTLNAAGVTGGAWWSFSLAGGSLSPANCMNGTFGSFSLTENPGLGDQNETDSQWMQATFGSFCNTTGRLLCVCFIPE